MEEFKDIIILSRFDRFYSYFFIEVKDIKIIF